MKLVIGQSRRITIPSELYSEINFKPGDVVYMYVEGNKLVLTKETPKNETINNIDTTQKRLKTNCSTLQTPKNSTATKNIIVKSNIEDLNKYAKPILSDCKLVVRSKRKYINQFCDVCKGKLADNSNCNCKYRTPDINKEPVKNKEIIKQLEVNKKQLETKIDKEIQNFSNDRVYFKGSTVLEPVTFSNGLKCCTSCEEYFTRGFLLDNKFYCKDCTKKHFLDYMKYRKEGRN